MNELIIPVADAAKDFLGILARVERDREPAILLRGDQPVARLVPYEAPASSCEELASRWEKLKRLPAEESEAFANDIESSRKKLPPLKGSWD